MSTEVKFVTILQTSIVHPTYRNHLNSPLNPTKRNVNPTNTLTPSTIVTNTHSYTPSKYNSPFQSLLKQYTPIPIHNNN